MKRLFSKRLAMPIVVLAVPIMLQGVLMNLMGFVDALMIGQLGEEVISALGNSQQLISFLHLLIVFVAFGGSILIAQHKGARQPKQIDETALAVIQGGLVFGIVLGLILYFFGEGLVSLLTTDAFKTDDLRSAVPQQATVYLNIVAFAMPAMVLSHMLTSVMNAVGDTKTPVKIGVGFNVLNFVLNYVLIFGMPLPGVWSALFTPLGFQGAAIATFIASLLQSCTLFYVARKKDNGIELSFRRLLKPYWSIDREIFRLGYPSSVDGFYWQGARVFYTVLINAIGATAYAAYVIVRTLKSLFMLPISGLQTATAVRIGHLLGAGQFQRAKATASVAILVGVAIMSIPALLLVLFAESLLSLYAIGADTQQMALWCIWVLAFSLFFTAVNAVIPGLLRAGGDAAAVMHITLISFIAFGAPLSWLLGIYLEYGLLGAFIGISLEEVFKAGLFIRRMRKFQWLKQIIRRG